MRALRGRDSGLCQPAYVLDIPGGHGKSPIGPNYLERAGLKRAEHIIWSRISMGAASLSAAA